MLHLFTVYRDNDTVKMIKKMYEKPVLVVHPDQTGSNNVRKANRQCKCYNDYCT